MDDAKLWFIYGAMGSCKTANALMVRFNYQERGMKAALLKPMIECRDGKKNVKSRIGLSSDCEYVEDFLANVEVNGAPKIDCVIVDEAQFLTREQVDDLSDIVDKHNIPVMCYGLKTDFQGNAFPGSARLLELADEIVESSTVCWCGRKARFNARVCDGHIVREGEQVQLGGNESYTSLCRKHFKEGIICKPVNNRKIKLNKKKPYVI
ncbi:thymidine kinase [bacterium]|nr:thymidine kinase [bacterium]